MGGSRDALSIFLDVYGHVIIKEFSYMEMSCHVYFDVLYVMYCLLNLSVDVNFDLDTKLWLK